MTDSNLTEIVCVLDRSGSMGIVVDDAIGGFNTMLADQQAIEEGEANVTIVLFDDEYRVVVKNTPVKDVKPLDRRTYVPRGSTALLDAVGRTIDDTGRRLASLPEEKRAGKLLFIILTDGQENCSNQYSYKRVAHMIKHHTEKHQWTFIYLSAHLQAFRHAQQLGVQTSVRYTSSAKGTRKSYGLVSDSVRQYRAGGASGMSIMNSCVDITNDNNTVDPNPPVVESTDDSLKTKQD